ncbi:MAG TPA: aspartate aminotransferase family protein [Syntrophomonadaceae bacterium]|nr:aspartate aminotransferase family protein [Syntrophomonadaceae bacterium]
MTNLDYINKGNQYVLNTYNRFPLSLVKGQGSYVWDADGKQYLDFVSGIAVCALGHCNPELTKVVQEQARNLWHVSNLYWNEPQVTLAEKLVNSTGLGKAFFCNSGAEANEAAIKLARKYFYRKNEARRQQIITFKRSFHGRTIGALTATGQAKYHEGFAPLLEGFLYAEYNNLASVEELIDDNLAAIMVEPIQGEGGIRPAELPFFRGLREICNREGILLILDEVQTGVGRTGKMWAYEHYGIKPDILTLAKALGGGIPIGAILASDEAATGFAPGDHAATFGGNPLVTAVANRVVDIINQPQFLDNVQNMGRLLAESLQDIGDEGVVTIRGRGLLIGMEFKDEVKDLINLCMNQGLLLVGAGSHIVRFVPPLNINEVEIKQAVNIFRSALKKWARN